MVLMMARKMVGILAVMMMTAVVDAVVNAGGDGGNDGRVWVVYARE